MKMKEAQNIGALLMVMVALGVVSWLALQGNEQSGGALISVVAGGVSYFLRGRVQESNDK